MADYIIVGTILGFVTGIVLTCIIGVFMPIASINTLVVILGVLTIVVGIIVIIAAMISKEEA